MDFTKRFLLFSFFVSVFIPSFGQVPAIQWQKSYGGTEVDFANCVRQTADGGYIIGGVSMSNNGDVIGNHGIQDYWIVKINSTGGVEWKKCFGGSNIDFTCYKIEQTPDLGYIAVGWTRSTDGDVIGNHGGDDCWVIKLSNAGLIEWQKCLGGTSNDYCTSVSLTKNGGYIVTGEAFSNDGNAVGNHGDYDFLVVKLSQTGNIEWQRMYGGTGREEPMDIRQTSDGGYIVAGDASSNNGDVFGNHGNYDFWILKLSNNGQVEWQKCFGGTGSDSAMTIQQTSDGGYIVGGSSASNDGDVTGNHGMEDFWVVKMSNLGVLEWQKSFGGSQPELITFGGGETPEGGYVFSGWTFSNNGNVNGNHGLSDYWIIKMDVNGNLVWQKCLGGASADYLTSMQQTIDGGFILAGTSNSFDGDITNAKGGGDYWIVKLNIDPVLAGNYINFNVIAKSNAVQIAWSFASTDNTAASYSLEKSLDGKSFNELCNLTAGKINYQIFDVLPTQPQVFYRIRTIEKNGNSWYSNIEKVAVNNVSRITLFPNPFKSAINIQIINNLTGIYKYDMYGADGKYIASYSFHLTKGTNTVQLDLNTLSSGTYFLKPQAGTAIKVVKQ